MVLHYIIHYDLCIVEASLLQITDTEVMPQQTKSIQISLQKQTVACKVDLLMSRSR